MKSIHIHSGRHVLAGIFHPPTARPMDTAVLIVPPFGWDDQTSYRPRHDWSLALAAGGFANLRIDLPGTGDSSGTARDHGLVDAWAAAVGSGIQSLRDAGARRVAVIALGSGGLMTLQAIARGSVVEDLVLWGMPSTGRALIREIKAFGRIEQFQTGESPNDMADGELRAGGHLLTPETLTDLAALDAIGMIDGTRPSRALLLGRDGSGPDPAVAEAFRLAGWDVRRDPGHGWGEALARPQSIAPTALFQTVNSWLGERAAEGQPLSAFGSEGAELNGGVIRERGVIFEGDGQQLYAVITEPVRTPVLGGTVVMFNAGAIRRIGPNRMWTEAARRWAATGVPVIRLDVEGIGDAAGENSAYIAGDESFYVPSLTAQARAALDLAVAQRLPGRFLLAGLCSGAYWAFEAAVADPRVAGIVMLNPRLLKFDANAEGDRELRKLGRVFTRKGLHNLFREKRKLRRILRFAAYLLRSPLRLLAGPQNELAESVSDSFRTLHARQQRVDIAFSGDEPLHEEMLEQGRIAELEAVGVTFHALPYASHTLKPAKAQQAANAVLDQVVAQLFPPLALDTLSPPKKAASAR